MSDEDPPGEGGGESNLTAARFLPGRLGNPGGRPKDLRGFRKACRAKGWAWLAELQQLMTSDLTPPAEKLAIWKAVCDRGGYLPADKTFARDGGAFVPPPDGPPPGNVTGAVDMAIRALGAQVAALEQVARARPLDADEQRRLEGAAQQLADIETSRGRLLIQALQTGQLNKDSGKTLTAMFGGHKVAPKPEEAAKAEEPK